MPNDFVKMGSNGGFELNLGTYVHRSPEVRFSLGPVGNSGSGAQISRADVCAQSVANNTSILSSASAGAISGAISGARGGPYGAAAGALAGAALGGVQSSFRDASAFNSCMNRR